MLSASVRSLVARSFAALIVAVALLAVAAPMQHAEAATPSCPILRGAYVSATAQGAEYVVEGGCTQLMIPGNVLPADATLVDIRYVTSGVSVANPVFDEVGNLYMQVTIAPEASQRSQTQRFTLKLSTPKGDVSFPVKVMIAE